MAIQYHSIDFSSGFRSRHGKRGFIEGQILANELLALDQILAKELLALEGSLAAEKGMRKLSIKAEEGSREEKNESV